MERYTLLPALFILLFGQSCIHGDLDDCPPMVQYAVAFEYTNHTGSPADRFYEDVKKIDLFVFDDNEFIYTTKTEIRPFDTNLTIPLDIPMGIYDIIAWGNVMDDQPIVIEPAPAEFIPGVTTLDEARCILQTKAGNLSDTELEKLFFGEIMAEIPSHISRVDTIPLNNDTKRIRVVLHWDYNNLPPQSRIDHQNVAVRLTGTNARYRFHNDCHELDVVYAPYHVPYNQEQTDSILELDDSNWLQIAYGDESLFRNLEESKVYDFSVLRLFKDMPLTLTVEHRYPSMNPVPIHTAVNILCRDEGFSKMFDDRMRIVESQWQFMYDRYDDYRIDIFVVQKELNTFVTGSINFIDWKKIKDDTEV